MVLVRLLLIGLAAAAAFLAWKLHRRSRPVEKALRWARAGKTAEAEAYLQAVAARKPGSAVVRGAIGKVCLMERRLPEAEAELRRAVVLECRDASSWRAGVDPGRPRPARRGLALRGQAYATSGEDLEVYCLYCGLMARRGRVPRSPSSSTSSSGRAAG